MNTSQTHRLEKSVTSETGKGEYQLVHVNGVWKCTCTAYIKQKTPCKHVNRLMEYLQTRDGGLEPDEIEAGMVVPPPIGDSAAFAMSKWVKKIHGRDFIQYEGLLALAHERGLQQLGAALTLVTDKLATAIAWAQFLDGRCFWEAGDATPDNVNVNVKAHFPRVALTRAKARCLRDALNMGMVAVEELEE